MILFDPIQSPYLVPFDGRFQLRKMKTRNDSESSGKKRLKKRLASQVEGLEDLQRRLYADDRFSVLLVFQAMDAAGKDGTIRAVMTGVNPAGCQVFAFKRPSSEELDHDFLWRINRALPERGRIGIFNRSHYEEVLVVRVHPELLEHQSLPRIGEEIWQERFESIRDFERHLARNGTVILKFFLHVSPEEQRRRLLARIDEDESNWKFEAGDLRERALWSEYMIAYEEALRETSRSWAPWYVIPADDKPYMRATVAGILRQTLEGMKLSYPQVGEAERLQLESLRGQLALPLERALPWDDRDRRGAKADEAGKNQAGKSKAAKSKAGKVAKAGKAAKGPAGKGKTGEAKAARAGKGKAGKAAKGPAGEGKAGKAGAGKAGKGRGKAGRQG